MAIGVAAGGSVIVALVLVIILARKRRGRKIHFKQSGIQNPRYAQRLASLELERECVTVTTELGEGQFGKVWGFTRGTVK